VYNCSRLVPRIEILAEAPSVRRTRVGCATAVALLALVLIGAGSAVAQEKQEKESGNLEQERQAWFYGQRAYPHQYVPSGAHLRAVSQLRRKVAAEAAAAKLAAKPLTAPAWSAIGPQPIDTPYTDPVVSGRLTAIAIDPANTNHVYVAGAQGGVWQTTNGGTTWTAMTDTQPSLAVGSLILDPTNSSTIYVGTGEENFSGDSYYGEGILKSTDGGATWTQYCGPFCGPVGQDGYYGGGRAHRRLGRAAIQQPGVAGRGSLAERGWHLSFDRRRNDLDTGARWKSWHGRTLRPQQPQHRLCRAG
jgi:hypothetical protein